MRYDRTKDVILVQQSLGHKSINSTLKYMSLEKALLKTDEEKWITRVAKDIRERQNWWRLGLNFTAASAREGSCSENESDTLIYLTSSLFKGK